jgi:hypothetical protein
MRRLLGMSRNGDPAVFASITDLALGDGLLTRTMLLTLIHALRHPS